MSSFAFWLPVGLYFIGWVVDFVRYWRAAPAGSQWSAGLLAVGWGAHTIFLASQLFDGAAALPNLLSGVAWLAIIIYYVILRRFDGPVFGFVFPPFAIAAMLVAALVSVQSILSLERLSVTPTVMRNVLITHITTVLAGHVLFALACLFGIVYLYQQRQIKHKNRGLMGSRLPSLGALEHLNHRAIILGFFFLSVGILLGVLLSGLNDLPLQLLTWRQIIPLITWLVYAVFLLEHSLQGRRGRISAIWSIAGFVIVTTSLAFELILVFAHN